MLPLLIFASARAGVAFTPVNYRLSADGIKTLIARLPEPLVVVDSRYLDELGGPDGLAGIAKQVLVSDDFLAQARDAEPAAEFADPDSVGIVLFTSGTTSQPKAVELTHNNLTSYVTGTVEFASAEPTDAALICVPPYHIAGSARRCRTCTPDARWSTCPSSIPRSGWIWSTPNTSPARPWCRPCSTASSPCSQQGGHQLPSLRNLAYGGSKVPLPLVRTALELLPQVGFVNAYGLTETSSTIAVLTPEDHREAHTASDPAVIRRLGSVGQPVPSIEVQIRDENGTVLGPGETGELFVRGEQVSGRYTGIGSVLDAEGWFPTKDIATLDEDGYLFVSGRSDDTIIRGGENIAPAELEDVLVEHPHVRHVAVVGVDDPQWGQAIVAVVVPAAGIDPDPEELREHVRKSLRGSRTPDRVVFRDELPTNATGKVLRRDIVEELRAAPAEQ